MLKKHIFIGRSKHSITRQHLKIRCRGTNLIKEQGSMEWNRWKWMLQEEADLLCHEKQLSV